MMKQVRLFGCDALIFSVTLLCYGVFFVLSCLMSALLWLGVLAVCLVIILGGFAFERAFFARTCGADMLNTLAEWHEKSRCRVYGIKYVPKAEKEQEAVPAEPVQ